MISTPFRKKSFFHEKLHSSQCRCRQKNHHHKNPGTAISSLHLFLCHLMGFQIFFSRQIGCDDHHRKTSPNQERSTCPHQMFRIVVGLAPQKHHQCGNLQYPQYNVHKRSPFPFICNPFRKLQNPHDDYSDDNHSHQNDGAFIFRHGLFFCHRAAVLAHFRTQISRNDHDGKTSPNQNGRTIANKIPCIIIGTASQKYYQCQDLHSTHDHIHV